MRPYDRLWPGMLLISLLLTGAAYGQTVPIVAEVNGVPITRRSFQIDYRKAVEEHARKGNPVNQAYLKDLRRRLLGYLVETELLLQDARQQGIRVTDQELDQKLAAERSASAGEAAFSARLQALGMSPAEYRERRRQALVIQKLIAQHIARDIVIRDKDIEDFYDQHPERFTIPEQLHIRHITLRLSPDADESQKAAVHARILEIQRQLATGADFATLAYRYSEDPSRDQKGDTGFLDADLAARKFGQRVLDITTGQVGPPLETPWGYHLVVIEARRPPRQIPLVKVRAWIRQTLFQQRTRAPVKSYVKALREKADIVIHE